MSVAAVFGNMAAAAVAVMLPVVQDTKGTKTLALLFAASGGGGSSWAKGAGDGVTLPTSLTKWQTLANNDPGQVVITVQCPNCYLFSICGMENTEERPVMRCTFTQSTLSLDLSILAEAIEEEIDQQVGDQVPVYIEAWGGHGGTGGAAKKWMRQRQWRRRRKCRLCPFQHHFRLTA